MDEQQIKDALMSLRAELWKMVGEAAKEEDAGKYDIAQNGMTSIRNLSHVLGVALPDRTG